MTSADSGSRPLRRVLSMLLVGATLTACDVPTMSPGQSDLGSAASTSPGASASPSAAASPDGAAADLASALDILDRVHPEPFHGLERQEFVAALDDYIATLPNLSREEGMVEFMRVWAYLSRDGRDGHQFALPQARHAGPMLPIRVYEFSEGVYVTAAIAPHEDLVGSRITAVAGVPIDHVLALLEPLVPRDGPATVPSFRPLFFLRADVLRGLGVVSGNTIPLEVEIGGQSQGVDLAPVAADEFDEWTDGTGPHQLPLDPDVPYLASAEPFSAQLLDDGVAYLRYRSVQNADVRQVRRWLDAGQFDRLVLDLRQNPGGDNGTYGTLLRLVQDFAESHPESLSVLIDRVTFSAASNLTTEIERTTDARFIGEPMGGGLNFWNDVTWVDLPNLPIPMRVGVSTRYWQFAADPDDPRLTIDPDVPVEVTAADHFAGRDPALEAALTP